MYIKTVPFQALVLKKIVTLLKKTTKMYIIGPRGKCIHCTSIWSLYNMVSWDSKYLFCHLTFMLGQESGQQWEHWHQTLWRPALPGYLCGRLTILALALLGAQKEIARITPKKSIAIAVINKAFINCKSWSKPKTCNNWISQTYIKIINKK